MTDRGVSILNVMLHMWLLNMMRLGCLVMQNGCFMVDWSCLMVHWCCLMVHC